MGSRDYHSAAGGNGKLAMVLTDLDERVIGIQKQVAPPHTPPPVCSFTVGGQDASFTIDITNPQDVNSATISLAQQKLAQGVDINSFSTPVTHQLQSSLTRNYDAAGDVRTYGPDTKTHWVITDLPDQTRYWRLRSSYDGGVTWNTWKEYQNPLLCGIIAVWSGQVRSTTMMANVPTNVTNFATVSSVIDGGNADILVFGVGGPGTGWYRQIGAVFEGLNGSGPDSSKLTPFPSATLMGYAQGTTYDVFYDKQFGIFRVLDPVAQWAQGLADGLRFAGQVITVTPGGGGGGGPDATATATVGGGAVTAIAVTNHGSGYTSTPGAVILGDGTGARAVVVMAADTVGSITMVAGGSGYTAATVSFVGGRGTDGGGGAGGGSGGVRA